MKPGKMKRFPLAKPDWLGPTWRAYGLAVGVVAACTVLNRLLFERVTESNLIMVYFLGLLPVALTGVPGAALLAALLAVAVFNFFFTAPYYTLMVYDPRYYSTFLVMGLVGILISTLMARLAAESKTSEQRARRAEALSRELDQANRELTTLDRMKRDLISNVSHELRTPLAAIVGNAELLQDEMGGPLTPTQQGMVGSIQQGADRLGRMVGFLVDFSQLEAGDFTFEIQTADLRGLVHDTVARLLPQAQEAKLTLKATLPEGPVWVDMDPTRIGQVLVNLLENALKFTPPGGQIEVSLGQTPDSVRVAVRDTGIGIAPEHLPHLFTKFYQVDASSTRAYGGAGLGLAFSKALVEAQGGAIGVTSTPGHGSTFWFRLPRVRQVHPEDATRADAASPRRGERVS